MLISQNPATGTILKKFPVLTKKAVQQRVARADHAFQSWKNLSYKKRATLFLRLADELERDVDACAALITAEMGKPITQSRAEVLKCALNCRYYAKNTEKFLRPEVEKTEAKKSYVRFDPLGVILFIMPWNFPFWQALRQAAPTMMAGNTVLLKHAGNVPQCAQKIGELFRKAGFPQNAFQNLPMTTEYVEDILSDFRVKGVSLTGSVRAGSIVAGLAGKNIKTSVMELGGSDPFIVLNDANVTEAAKQAAASRLISCGQSCIAAKRFIVTKKNLKKFVDEHVKAFAQNIVDDPTKEETTIGPVSSAQAAEGLARQVRQSVKKGAKIVFGDGKADGAWFTPTILVNVKPGMPAYDEELFGPVSSIIVAKDEKDAVRIANDIVYGLSSSIWTKNTKKAEKIAREINAGAVFVNTFSKSDPRMPFGGINHGGFGRELGVYGVKEFANIKSVWVEK